MTLPTFPMSFAKFAKNNAIFAEIKAISYK